MTFHPIALFIALPVILLTLTFVYMIRVSTLAREQRRRVAGQPDSLATQARRVAYWTLTLVLSTLFILAGLPKLVEFNLLAQSFSHWGYSESFLTFIGATELIAAIFLLIPRTALYAAGYLSIIMAGAIYTHLAFDPLSYAALPALALAGLSFIIYERIHQTDSGLARSRWQESLAS